jgi:16S rRNA (cytidine1402-2'-O)-methyltransferase
LNGKAKQKGKIYIVATPIGHLDDITFRAVEVLKFVDKIATEDTRHSLRLLKHLAIQKPLVVLHEHNERNKTLKLLMEVQGGVNLALISDAGTPLISDPGYHLVRLAHEKQIQVVPIPGPCAAIAALCVGGLPTDRFVFEGFLPAKTHMRHKRLAALMYEVRTLIFFESPHRILETLQAMCLVFGGMREVVIARELTKTFETIRQGTLSQLLEWLQVEVVQQRGEFVVLVAGMKEDLKKQLTPEAKHLLEVLMTELSIKQASILAGKITGINKRLLYEYGLEKQKKLS